jgi:major vault protein
VDIQSVEPESRETQDKLKKSVTLAIKIATESKEAHFRHEQTLLDQQNKGQLQKTKIEDDKRAEILKSKLQ